MTDQTEYRAPRCPYCGGTLGRAEGWAHQGCQDDNARRKAQEAAEDIRPDYTDPRCERCGGKLEARPHPLAHLSASYPWHCPACKSYHAHAVYPGGKPAYYEAVATARRQEQARRFG